MPIRIVTVQGYKESKLVPKQYNFFKAAEIGKSLVELVEIAKRGIAKGGAVGQYHFNNRDVVCYKVIN